MVNILEKALFLQKVLDSVKVRGLRQGGESYALQSLIRKLLEQLPSDKQGQAIPTTLIISFSPLTKESLKEILELMGFRVDTIEEIPNYYWGNGKQYRHDENDYIVTLRREE